MACSWTALPFLISPNVGGRLVSSPATCCVTGFKSQPGAFSFLYRAAASDLQTQGVFNLRPRKVIFVLTVMHLAGFYPVSSGLPLEVPNTSFIWETRNFVTYFHTFWSFGNYQNLATFQFCFKIGLPWRALLTTYLEANGASNPEAALVTAVTMDAVLNQPESSWHLWRYSERLGRILGNVPKTNIFIQILVCQRAFEMALFLRLAVSMKRREQLNESLWKSVFESSAKFCW
jgi:hypothetical protein